MKDTTSESTASQPCAMCGEETAAGSVFFSDRRTIDAGDGVRTYLCSLCAERIAARHRGRRLSDEEIRSLVNNLSASASAFVGGH